jgi:hypothetical protein
VIADRELTISDAGRSAIRGYLLLHAKLTVDLLRRIPLQSQGIGLAYKIRYRKLHATDSRDVPDSNLQGRILVPAAASRRINVVTVA